MRLRHPSTPTLVAGTLLLLCPYAFGQSSIRQMQQNKLDGYARQLDGWDRELVEIGNDISRLAATRAELANLHAELDRLSGELSRLDSEARTQRVVCRNKLSELDQLESGLYRAIEGAQQASAGGEAGTAGARTRVRNALAEMEGVFRAAVEANRQLQQSVHRFKELSPATGDQPQLARIEREASRALSRLQSQIAPVDRGLSRMRWLGPRRAAARTELNELLQDLKRVRNGTPESADRNELDRMVRLAGNLIRQAEGQESWSAELVRSAGLEENTKDARRELEYQAVADRQIESAVRGADQVLRGATVSPGGLNIEGGKQKMELARKAAAGVLQSRPPGADAAAPQPAASGAGGTGSATGSGGSAASQPPPPPPSQPPAAPAGAPGHPAAPTSSDHYGGLQITPQATRIKVGEAVQLRAIDHGGRGYSGASWSCSDTRFLTVSTTGMIVGRAAGDATVLVRVEDMGAWLDVKVEKRGGTTAGPSQQQPPAGTAPGSGTPTGGAPGSGSATGATPGSTAPGGQASATSPGAGAAGSGGQATSTPGAGAAGPGTPGTAGDGSSPSAGANAGLGATAGSGSGGAADSVGASGGVTPPDASGSTADASGLPGQPTGGDSTGAGASPGGDDGIGSAEAVDPAVANEGGGPDAASGADADAGAAAGTEPIPGLDLLGNDSAQAAGDAGEAGSATGMEPLNMPFGGPPPTGLEAVGDDAALAGADRGDAGEEGQTGEPVAGTPATTAAGWSDSGWSEAPVEVTPQGPAADAQPNGAASGPAGEPATSGADSDWSDSGWRDAPVEVTTGVGSAAGGPSTPGGAAGGAVQGSDPTGSGWEDSGWADAPVEVTAGAGPPAAGEGVPESESPASGTADSGWADSSWDEAPVEAPAGSGISILGQESVGDISSSPVSPPAGGGTSPDRTGRSGSPRRIIGQLLQPADLAGLGRGIGHERSGWRLDTTNSWHPSALHCAQVVQDPERCAAVVFVRKKLHPTGSVGMTESTSLRLVRWKPSELGAAKQSLVDLANDQRRANQRNNSASIRQVSSLGLGDLSYYDTWGGWAKVIDGQWSFQIGTWLMWPDAASGQQAPPGSPIHLRASKHYGGFIRHLSTVLHSRLERAIGSSRQPAQAPQAGGAGSASGKCWVGCKPAVRPLRCAVACDGQFNATTALARGGHTDYRLKNASWERCAEKMRELGQLGW